MLLHNPSLGVCSRGTRQASPGLPRGSANRRSLSARATPAPASVETKAWSKPELLPLDASYESAHAFTQFANWLIPGHVMLGRYPFIEPSRCTDRAQGEQQLATILLEGVTTFVCLQEELPSQDLLKLQGKAGFMPYKTTAELINRALNPSAHGIGIRNPTRDAWLPPRRAGPYKPVYKPVELSFVHSPVVDMGLPSSEALGALVVDLKSRLAAGEKLYIHCWGGRGRAGTVGASLLTMLYGLDADTALARVQRAFDTRRDSGRLSPETDEQREFVRAFAAEGRRA